MVTAGAVDDTQAAGPDDRTKDLGEQHDIDKIMRIAPRVNTADAASRIRRLGGSRDYPGLHGKEGIGPKMVACGLHEGRDIGRGDALRRVKGVDRDRW